MGGRFGVGTDTSLWREKQATVGIYASLQLATLSLWASPGIPRTRLSIPSACLSFVSAVLLAPVSHYEHTKSLRPSTALGLFLSLTLLFDAAICRTL